jgi:uncharacterized protein (DUF488 family)
MLHADLKGAVMRVWTIGHSTRAPEEFVRLLKENGIERLVDVRTVPRSRHVPWAGIDELPDLLAKNGVLYEHLAALGGLRKARSDSPNDAWRNASFRGYADHMQTAEFERGLEELLSLARERPTAIMCAEAVPWRCHRSLVADALLARGVEVLNIVGAGAPKPATLTPFARVTDGKVTYPAAPGKQAKL